MGKVIPLNVRMENSILEAQIALDAFLLLHSHLGPEEIIDMTLADLKKEMLELFYERFPGQRKT